MKNEQPNKMDKHMMMEMPVPTPTATGAGPQIHPGGVTVSAEVILVYEFKWILSQGHSIYKLYVVCFTERFEASEGCHVGFGCCAKASQTLNNIRNIQGI